MENLVDITASFGIHLTETEEIGLSSQEENLLEILRGGEKHISELAVLSGKKPYELQPLLVSLEMKNRIADCGGNVTGVHYEKGNTESINGCFLRIEMETRDNNHVKTIKNALREAGFRTTKG